MKLIFLVTVLLCLLVTGLNKMHYTVTIRGVVAPNLNLYILVAPANVDAVALGAPCNPNGGTQGDCTDANAICPSTGTAECECKTGYTEFSGVCVEDGTAGGACLSSSACTGDTLVCEPNVCKIKAGAACTSGSTNCVSQSTCSTSSSTCTCNNGFSAASTGLCTAIDQGKVNAVCDTTTKLCTGRNVECTNGFCTCKAGSTGNKGDADCIITPGTAGGACLTNPACTGDTLVCQSSVCKIKAGAACTSPTAHCVPQSTCSTTCKCDDGYTALQTGLCTAIDQGKVNAACDGTRVCTGTNVECTGGFCTCKDGFSGNKGDNDCTSNKGVALGQVSVWTLCMTILTVSLAVNVV